MKRLVLVGVLVLAGSGLGTAGTRLYWPSVRERPVIRLQTPLACRALADDAAALVVRLDQETKQLKDAGVALANASYTLGGQFTSNGRLGVAQGQFVDYVNAVYNYIIRGESKPTSTLAGRDEWMRVPTERADCLSP